MAKETTGVAKTRAPKRSAIDVDREALKASASKQAAMAIYEELKARPEFTTEVSATLSRYLAVPKKRTTGK